MGTVFSIIVIAVTFIYGIRRMIIMFDRKDVDVLLTVNERVYDSDYTFSYE